jgi:polyphosphate kinase
MYAILKMPLDLSKYYRVCAEVKEISRFKNWITNNPNKPMPVPIAMLIKTPIDSFRNISTLISAASEHPENVREIYVTAYRLGENSSIINDLIQATKNGIYCKLYLELSARGEIDRDLVYLEKILNEANHQYLDVKFKYNNSKVHGKMIYIGLKSDKPSGIGIFSTGNYNAATSAVYKDYHYISCEKNVIEMIQRNFATLWNSEQPVLSSISNILSKEIYEEIAKGKDGKIWIQTNHLDNKHIVNLLKEAIRRGCDVKLIVRTTKGFHNKELKNCKTIVGKYLEHARVYIFGSSNDRRVYLSSSDILYRNLYNRFESYIKVTSKAVEKQLIDDFRDLYRNGQR